MSITVQPVDTVGALQFAKLGVRVGCSLTPRGQHSTEDNLPLIVEPHSNQVGLSLLNCQHRVIWKVAVCRDQCGQQAR